jgi:transcriptional regulator with GAF, ATPase, and Fis domain
MKKNPECPPSAEASYFFPGGLPTRKPSRVSSKELEMEDWFWGKSAAMAHLREELQIALRSKINVLIVGETGSGKEVLARILYQQHLRNLHLNESEAPFVPVNCAAIPENLAESILFGHERGAFTSARERQYGKFESARKGMIFLDEIQNLALSTQAKLLRVLQSREIDRLGSKSSAQIECRVVAASNLPLELLTENRRFRRDLYYRLNVCPLYLPALRHRLEDLPQIVEGLQRRIESEHGVTARQITRDSLRALESYSWPGNIRELEHCLLYAGLRAQEAIEVEHLAPQITGRLHEYLSMGDWRSTMDAAEILSEPDRFENRQ